MKKVIMAVSLLTLASCSSDTKKVRINILGDNKVWVTEADTMYRIGDTVWAKVTVSSAQQQCVIIK